MSTYRLGLFLEPWSNSDRYTDASFSPDEGHQAEIPFVLQKEFDN